MNKYQKVVESAKKFVEENIENSISPDDVAKTVNYSLRQLNRIFSMVTGITVSEYLRWHKLTRSLFELKYSDMPVIEIALKYGYESQESYMRAFKDVFSINPGEYKKTNQHITAKNWHINQLIHKEAHNALDNGFHKLENVESWIIIKPDRIWVSARKNTQGLCPGEFYDLPGDDLLKRAFTLPDTISGGGAYFPSENNKGLSFGVEVSEDYPSELLEGFELIRIPQFKYVVFNYPKYPVENHGDAIGSVWNAKNKYDITAQGLEWALDKMPFFEDDNDEMGYTLWFPVCDIKK